MNRQLRRAALKEQYRKFCEAWKNEKRYQNAVIVGGSDLPEGVHKLGRKPTFAMWLAAHENQRMARKEAEAGTSSDPKRVEVTDTEW